MIVENPEVVKRVSWSYESNAGIYAARLWSKVRSGPGTRFASRIDRNFTQAL
jgi:hypothetical protein